MSTPKLFSFIENIICCLFLIRLKRKKEKKNQLKISSHQVLVTIQILHNSLAEILKSICVNLTAEIQATAGRPGSIDKINFYFSVGKKNLGENF